MANAIGIADYVEGLGRLIGGTLIQTGGEDGAVWPGKRPLSALTLHPLR